MDDFLEKPPYYYKKEEKPYEEYDKYSKEYSPLEIVDRKQRERKEKAKNFLQIDLISLMKIDPDFSLSIGNHKLQVHDDWMKIRCPEILKKPVVDFTMSQNSVQLWMEYIYSNKLPSVQDLNVAIEILKLAELFKLNHLEGWAFVTAKSLLRADNIVMALKLVHNLNLEKMKKEIFRWVSENPKGLPNSRQLKNELQGCGDIFHDLVDILLGSVIPANIQEDRTWQEKEPDLEKDLEKLMEIRENNVELKCKDGKSIKCWKPMLCCRCTFFQKAFGSGMKESHLGSIELDIPSSAVEALIKYFFLGKIPYDDAVACLQISLYSDFLCLSEERHQILLEACTEKVEDGIEIDNCLDLLAAVYGTGNKELEKKLYLFVAKNYSTIFERDWEKMINLPDTIKINIIMFEKSLRLN